MKKAVVIGAGFSGLSAATSLAVSGFDVTLLEKHGQTGGRARSFEAEGFKFDMGPSWYWMPDVFENYFRSFGKSVHDYYELKRLDPSYRVFWEKDQWDVPAKIDQLKALFEQHEKGSGRSLDKFLKDAQRKYEIAMSRFVYKPGLSVREFVNWESLNAALKLDLLKPISALIRKHFTNPGLIQLLEFPSLFLGATATEIPAMYSLMNYADVMLGTWYPMGGMGEVVKAMTLLAKEKGVTIELNTQIDRIETKAGLVTQVVSADGRTFKADVLVASGDYAHMESLLSDSSRNYGEKYWNDRTMAPSALLFYLGVNKKLGGLQHHNLFFDESLERHSYQIYKDPAWPDKPLFYACVPSITDKTVAPEGCENLFLLMPLAPGLTPDSEEMRNLYLKLMLQRLEQRSGQNIADSIIYKRSYAMTDFESDYEAFKGNAYGLANTLRQTAFLKPKMINKQLKNMFYAGQLTVPGPGVPPSLISGKIAAELATKCSFA